MHTCVLSRFSHVRLVVTPWAVALHAPLSMGFSRQGYWNGLPCPPPGDLPDPGIDPVSLRSPALAGGFFTTSATWEADKYINDKMIVACKKWQMPQISSKSCGNLMRKRLLPRGARKASWRRGGLIIGVESRVCVCQAMRTERCF